MAAKTGIEKAKATLSVDSQYKPRSKDSKALLGRLRYKYAFDTSKLVPSYAIYT